MSETVIGIVLSFALAIGLWLFAVVIILGGRWLLSAIDDCLTVQVILTGGDAADTHRRWLWVALLLVVVAAPVVVLIWQEAAK